MQTNALRAKEAGPAGVLARLRAWWQKGEAPTEAPAEAPERSSRAKKTATATVAPLDPLRLMQWLWGSGHAIPGGKNYVLELVRPLGLSPAMSMLDLAAGLGGAAREITTAYGTWVTGLERNSTIAAAGMQLSKQANLEKKASVSPYDPAAVEFRKNAFDCVLGRGASFAVADKQRFFDAVIQGQKERGQLLLTELIRAPGEAGDRPELAAWAQREPYPPALWTLEQYTDCLAKVGYDIRITEEVTGRHRSMILAGWSQMLEEVNLRELPRQHIATIVDAAEFWMRRVAAIESGALKVYRIHALANRPRG